MLTTDPMKKSAVCVLVVDDHEENCYYLESLLGSSGYLVKSARNGREALEALKTFPADVIITDILMPELDGYHLCRTVKSDESLRHIVIIIYTATYTGPKDEELAMKIGAQRFVVKPCSPEQLLEIVSEAAAHTSDSDWKQGFSEEEDDVLKLYNQRLIRKLEGRMLQLEQEVASRKQAEETLLEREQQLSNAVQIARLGHWELDVAENMLTLSDSFYAIFRTDAEAQGGYTLPVKEYSRRFVHPDDQPLLEEETRRAVETDDPDYCRYLEHRMIYADGETGFIAVRFFIKKDSEGNTEKTFGVNQDITERKAAEEETQRLQEQLLQSQKLESVGRLAGGIAHDFNNMLGVILGYTELALERIGDQDPLYHELKQVYHAAERSSLLTSQLLAFARKQAIVPKILNMNSNIENMLSMLKHMIGEDIDIQWKPAGNLPDIKMDGTQIDQVLLNLCVNAKDAIAGQGTVTISTDSVHFDHTCSMSSGECRPGGYVVLSVTDTGCGMNPHALEQVFEPFYTTKPLGKGTGLGLSTVYGIVKQNGGFLHVSSEPGKGSTFRVYIPAWIGESSRNSEILQPDDLGDREAVILIVDDDPMFRDMTKDMVEKLGYTAVEAIGPEEAAVRTALFSQIHLLITDVIMPKINGDQLYAEMKSVHPELKCLFMSAYTHTVVAFDAAMPDGSTEFIQKPFTMKQMAEKLSELL